jgi:hypothetical protein
MSNVLLAGFGTLVSMIALAGFSVYQLEKEASEAHGPDVGRLSGPTEPADDMPHAA